MFALSNSLGGGLAAAVVAGALIVACVWFLWPFFLGSQLKRMEKKLGDLEADIAASRAALEAINANLCEFGQSLERRADALIEAQNKTPGH